MTQNIQQLVEETQKEEVESQRLEINSWGGGQCDRTLDDKASGGETQDEGSLKERWRKENKTEGGRQGDKTTAYLHADDSVYEE